MSNALVASSLLLLGCKYHRLKCERILLPRYMIVFQFFFQLESHFIHVINGTYEKLKNGPEASTNKFIEVRLYNNMDTSVFRERTTVIANFERFNWMFLHFFEARTVALGRRTAVIVVHRQSYTFVIFCSKTTCHRIPLRPHQNHQNH